MISLIQHFEADFLWKVSLKILNSGTMLKTFTHAYIQIKHNSKGKKHIAHRCFEYRDINITFAGSLITALIQQSTIM